LITCTEAVKQFWRYLDDDLAPKQQQLVDEHLGICRQCCGELEFARLLQGVLDDQRSVDELPIEVRERMARFVNELGR
jgi:predicted anti-sigma-YlaC factor YlaD